MGQVLLGLISCSIFASLLSAILPTLVLPGSSAVPGPCILTNVLNVVTPHSVVQCVACDGSQRSYLSCSQKTLVIIVSALVSMA